MIRLAAALLPTCFRSFASENKSISESQKNQELRLYAPRTGFDITTRQFGQRQRIDQVPPYMARQKLTSIFSRSSTIVNPKDISMLSECLLHTFYTPQNIFLLFLKVPEPFCLNFTLTPTRPILNPISLTPRTSLRLPRANRRRKNRILHHSNAPKLMQRLEHILIPTVRIPRLLVLHDSRQAREDLRNSCQA